MADYLITYDLAEGKPDPHKPFLSAAERLGLIYVVVAGPELYRLPNTTVWGQFKDIDAATAAFDAALAATESALKTKVVLEKRTISSFSAARVRSNVHKKPDPRWTVANNPFETAREHQLNDPTFK